MQLWGVFHLNPNGNRNQTPRVICDSKAYAEKAKKRFTNCFIAPYVPHMSEINYKVDPKEKVI